MITVEEIREALRKKMEADPDPLFAQVWKGPRHNEIGFTTEDGDNVVLSIRASV